MKYGHFIEKNIIISFLYFSCVFLFLYHFLSNQQTNQKNNYIYIHSFVVVYYIIHKKKIKYDIGFQVIIIFFDCLKNSTKSEEKNKVAFISCTIFDLIFFLFLSKGAEGATDILVHNQNISSVI